MTRREQLRADAIVFSRDLRERGLYALANSLSDSVDAAMFSDAEAEGRQTLESTAAYMDAERWLNYLLETCQRTLEDIANAPLRRAAKTVRAFGVELEPCQAVTVAHKLVEAAYEITREREQAERLVTIVYVAAS